MTTLTREQLLAVADRVGQRSGWDFTRVRASRDPVPWYYGEIVRRYLRPTDSVLDTGTGGGEKFISLAQYFARGVGIDSSLEMVQSALGNLTPTLAERLTFKQMDVHALRFEDATFDAVLNRHSIVDVGEVMRVLKPGGVFITQQVGPHNARNVTEIFGCGPGGQYAPAAGQDADSLASAFAAQGCAIVCRAEYDVPYVYHDLDSFVFWLKAIPIPEDFAMDRHWEQVARIMTGARIVAGASTSRGIQTNEHRTLLIVRKPL